MTYHLAFSFLVKMLPEQKERHAVLWDTPSKLFQFS
jgi:hypothetical protein